MMPKRFVGRPREKDRSIVRSERMNLPVTPLERDEIKKAVEIVAHKVKAEYGIDLTAVEWCRKTLQEAARKIIATEKNK